MNNQTIDIDKLTLGSIVALKSHPYTEGNSAIQFSGEPLLISPLMVVIEILKDVRSSFEENSGIQLSGKNTGQCKCTWYSHKNHKFEDEWFSIKLLKIIELKDSDLVEPDVKEKYGFSFSLRSIDLEGGKLKSSLNDTNANDHNNKKVTALLTFVPPVMQFNGTSKYESKEPIFDPKTNKLRRIVTQLLIKGKFYNPYTDKISEVSLPIEAIALSRKSQRRKLILSKATLKAVKFLGM